MAKVDFFIGNETTYLMRVLFVCRKFSKCCPLAKQAGGKASKTGATLPHSNWGRAQLFGALKIFER